MFQLTFILIVTFNLRTTYSDDSNKTCIIDCIAVSLSLPKADPLKLCQKIFNIRVQINPSYKNHQQKTAYPDKVVVYRTQAALVCVNVPLVK
jgi:hypothetical protein